jgi:hypothetical protein
MGGPIGEDYIDSGTIPLLLKPERGENLSIVTSSLFKNFSREITSIPDPKSTTISTIWSQYLFLIKITISYIA